MTYPEIDSVESAMVEIHVAEAHLDGLVTLVCEAIHNPIPQPEQLQAIVEMDASDVVDHLIRAKVQLTEAMTHHRRV